VRNIVKKYKRPVIAILLAIPIVAMAQDRMFDTDILTETFGFGDETKKSVALEDLHQGCPARDCIPSIDSPKFIAAGDAEFLTDEDVVLTLIRGDDVRAYPTRILNFHEIVNDTIDGEAIAITFCPLCGTGLAFSRVVDGEESEFGVSGVLYNSDLVMYDRRTDTLWDQIEGRGIVGELTGETLKMLPTTMARWSRWKEAHPNTRVLSTDTGFDQDYSENPYEKYQTSDRIVFPVSGTDDRIGPKTVVHGVYVDGVYIAWTEQLLKTEGQVTQEVNDRNLVISYHEDSSVSVQDAVSGKSYTPVRAFWFAWYAFHPDTVLRAQRKK
jgi:hypothetical protein